MSKLLPLELSQGTAKSVRIGKIPSPSPETYNATA
jgi:hypothetical protein